MDHLVDSHISEVDAIQSRNEQNLPAAKETANFDGNFLLNSLKETASKGIAKSLGNLGLDDLIDPNSNDVKKNNNFFKPVDLAKGFFSNNRFFGKKETVDSKNKLSNPMKETISMNDNPQESDAEVGEIINRMDRNEIRGAHKIEAELQDTREFSEGAFKCERMGRQSNN